MRSGEFCCRFGRRSSVTLPTDCHANSSSGPPLRLPPVAQEPRLHRRGRTHARARHRSHTAIFSVINGVLLRPLPYRDPNRLVTVCQSSVKRGFSQVVVTPATLRDWREQNSVFEELGGQIYESVNLTGVERPEHVHAAWTTPNYFSVFGVAVAVLALAPGIGPNLAFLQP